MKHPKNKVNRNLFKTSLTIFAAVVAVADVDENGGRQVVASIEQSGGKALFVAADVSQSAHCRKMVAAAEETYGKLDVLFNNAGVMLGGDDDAVATDEDVWERTMAINARGVFLGCKYGIPALRRADGGSIINTASFVARMGAATSQISYTASKGGVLAMSRELGVQFAREGILVNALSPGPVNTPLLQELFAKDPERAARRLVHIPLGRFAQPEEIAAAVAFLASDDSSFMTAAEFLVDGGISGAYVTPM